MRPSSGIAGTSAVWARPRRLGRPDPAVFGGAGIAFAEDAGTIADSGTGAGQTSSGASAVPAGVNTPSDVPSSKRRSRRRAIRRTRRATPTNRPSQGPPRSHRRCRTGRASRWRGRRTRASRTARKPRRKRSREHRSSADGGVATPKTPDDETIARRSQAARASGAAARRLPNRNRTGDLAPAPAGSPRRFDEPNGCQEDPPQDPPESVVVAGGLVAVDDSASTKQPAVPYEQSTLTGLLALICRGDRVHLLQQEADRHLRRGL